MGDVHRSETLNNGGIFIQLMKLPCREGCKEGDARSQSRGEAMEKGRGVQQMPFLPACFWVEGQLQTEICCH